MPTQHTVEPGDHISRIAHKHGFGDPNVIWNDGANAEIKSKRKNPNVLFTGDVVTVPDSVPKTESVATTKRHTFQASIPKLWLRIILLGSDQKPLAEVACKLTVEGTTHSLTTGADGLLKAVIPRNATEGALSVVSLGIETPLRIGHLHPVDQVSGYRDRLNNLGYFAGESEDPKDPQILSAVEEFQCDHKLTVDGNCGAGTQAKLLEVHGC